MPYTWYQGSVAEAHRVLESVGEEAVFELVLKDS